MGRALAPRAWTWPHFPPSDWLPLLRARHTHHPSALRPVGALRSRSPRPSPPTPQGSSGCRPRGGSSRSGAAAPGLRLSTATRGSRGVSH
eukprot:844601-Pyramimonas_sp.AAC.1